MFEVFYPDEYVASTYVIPFEKLYEEGYRGIIFDIDNYIKQIVIDGFFHADPHPGNIKIYNGTKLDYIELFYIDNDGCYC